MTPNTPVTAAIYCCTGLIAFIFYLLFTAPPNALPTQTELNTMEQMARIAAIAQGFNCK